MTARLKPDSAGKLSSQLMENSYILTGEMLGRGGFGIVWRGIRLSDGGSVAVKVVPTSHTGSRSSSAVRSTVTNELEVMEHVGDHPSLLGLEAAYVECGHLYLVTQIMETDLCDALMKLGPFPESDVLSALFVLLRGIERCHSRGVVHRDVKLDNVFLSRKNDFSTAKLGDFGLAHMQSWGAARGSAGSRQYMAPEVLAASHSSDSRYGFQSDVWSAGVVLYALLAQRFPFSGRDKAGLEQSIMAGAFSFKLPVWETVSEATKDLITKMLAVDPNARPTATEALAHRVFDSTRAFHQERERASESMKSEHEKRQVKTAERFNVRALLTRACLSKSRSEQQLANRSRRSASTEAERALRPLIRA